VAASERYRRITEISIEQAPKEEASHLLMATKQQRILELNAQTCVQTVARKAAWVA
jgi:hypothetical protein